MNPSEQKKELIQYNKTLINTIGILLQAYRQNESEIQKLTQIERDPFPFKIDDVRIKPCQCPDAPLLGTVKLVTFTGQRFSLCSKCEGRSRYPV